MTLSRALSSMRAMRKRVERLEHELAPKANALAALAMLLRGGTVPFTDGELAVLNLAADRCRPVAMLLADDERAPRPPSSSLAASHRPAPQQRPQGGGTP